MTPKQQAFTIVIDNLRKDLVLAVANEFFRVKDADETDVELQEYIDIDVCDEVNSDIDIRIGTLRVKDGKVFAVFEVVEVEDEVPLSKLTIDALLAIHGALSEMK